MWLWTGGQRTDESEMLELKWQDLLKGREMEEFGVTVTFASFTKGVQGHINVCGRAGGGAVSASFLVDSMFCQIRLSAHGGGLGS